MVSSMVLGGKGYRWRGRLIRTVTRNNAVCVSMPRKDSIVMVPCAIIPNVQYRITVTASKNSGNGALLINFFGGKHYDGDHVPLNVKSGDQRSYTVAVLSPNVPESIPMYFRVWRPNDATGTVFIKDITITTASGEIQMPREPRLPKIETKNSVKHPVKSRSKPKKEVRKQPTIQRVKESSDMKFKPYKSTKNITSVVDNVLIRNPEDVPKVSIITPTRDGIDLLKKCYEAMDKNTCYPNWEWIIGDSDSSDGTVEYLKGLEDARIKIVERGTTDGSFSTINNDLTKFATGEYYLFLNNDTEPQPFWLFEMMTKIHNNPEIGVVGARLLYPSKRVQHAGIAFIPQGPANLGKAVLGSFPKGFDNHDRFYQAVTGACLLVNARDFKEVGEFDPVYHFCYEDVDLCLKIRDKLNKKVLYAANAVLIHNESSTQKKHKTAGELQKAGIAEFKKRWMRKVKIDFPQYQKHVSHQVFAPVVSFVTCVNNISQYRRYILGSLFKNKSSVPYETIPILNFGNPHSAAQALNIGLDQARGEIVVFCHQDVLFYEGWIDLLLDRIEEVSRRSKKWGVLGTAGINKRDDCVGVVHSIKGTIQWQSTKRHRVFPVQTVDEHCMVIRKSSGLRFDEKTFNGFHFYGPDLCMSALSKGMMNFGILCPLVHDSSSGSLLSGKREFMRLLNALAAKWRPKFSFIRTPTSIVRRRSVRTFVRFKSK